MIFACEIAAACLGCEQSDLPHNLDHSENTARDITSYHQALGRSLLGMLTESLTKGERV